jgi:hypothetical protein
LTHTFVDKGDCSIALQLGLEDEEPSCTRTDQNRYKKTLPYGTHGMIDCGLHRLCWHCGQCNFSNRENNYADYHHHIHFFFFCALSNTKALQITVIIIINIMTKLALVEPLITYHPSGHAAIRCATR